MIVQEKANLLRNCLATAEILYHLPDFPKLLQSYIWQDMDLAPELPGLRRFLAFWESNLEGRLHSVTVTSCQLVKPRELQYATSEIRLH